MFDGFFGGGVLLQGQGTYLSYPLIQIFITKDDQVLVFNFLFSFLILANDNIYVPFSVVEHSGKGINGCYSRNANVFKRTWHSGIR